MAVHIKDLLKNYFKDTEKKFGDKNKINSITDRVLDERLNGHIHLKNIYKKKIFFSTNSSSFCFEFNLKKKVLLEEIRKAFPDIEDIVIKIG